MKYIIMGLFSLLAVTTQAQVRGIVKDNTGEPVPGANVFWVNTGQGVTTKEDGSFSISKPSKSHMLVISFIGFQNDTIHVSKKNQELDITLREGVELNEVNVVSRRMGTMKMCIRDRLQFASFETDQSVGHSILLLGGNVLFDDLDQIRQRHYGTAHDEVEQLFFLFGTGMTESDVFQSDGIDVYKRQGLY